MVKIEEIIFVYENDIRKHIKNKKEVIDFEKNKMKNLIEIYNKVQNLEKIWNVKYKIFLIHEPKVRVIMSLDIQNKIINHYVTRFLLIPKLEKRLDQRNVATRKGYGTREGRKLVKKYFLKIKKKYKKFYILKLDISKYFYNIDHLVLLKLLKPFLKAQEYLIIQNILNSTNQEYINQTIKKYREHLPTYQKNKGLPIGNMTSQFLAIYYLNELDHKIIHNYHIPNYIRYMDDFLLIHEDKKYLKDILKKIEQELNKIYHLSLNKKKTKITNNKEGVVFLGYHYKVKNNKIMVTLTSDKKKRIRKITKSWKNQKTEKIFCSLNSVQSEKIGFKYKEKWIKRGLNEFKKKISIL